MNIVHFPITEENIASFKRVYLQAVELQIGSFLFLDKVLLTKYGRVVLEQCEEVLNHQKQKVK